MWIKKYSTIIALPLIGMLSACTPSSSNSHEAHAVSSSSVMHMSEQTQADIKAVLYDKYLGGQKQGEAALLQSAFHPDSIMFRPDKTEGSKTSLRKWTDMHSVVAGWAEKANPGLDYKDYEIPVSYTHLTLPTIYSV